MPPRKIDVQEVIGDVSPILTISRKDGAVETPEAVKTGEKSTVPEFVSIVERLKSASEQEQNK